MFYLIIAAIVIVPWVCGIIFIFRSFSGSSSKDPKKEAIRLLRRESAYSFDEPKTKLLAAAADYLEGKQEASSPKNDIRADAPAIETNEPTKPLEIPEHHVAVNPLKSLENINIMLYLGAFLIVVAAGIFIGFNYQTLSGPAKTVFLLVFTLIFYLSGLHLYLRTEKIKPAGLTFTTIGMVLFPLVGLGAYKFMFNGQYGHELWFITSLLTLSLYLISLLLVKKVYINYLVTFTALSLFESFISLFSVPIHYYFWGMTIFALVLAALRKLTKFRVEVIDTMRTSSGMIQPISLFLSLILISQYGWQQAGINLILGSVFYFLLNLNTEKDQEKNLFFGFSLMLLPIGISLIFLNTSYEIFYLAFGMAFLALAYSVATAFGKNIFSSSLKAEILSYLTGILLIFAACLVTDNAVVLFWILLMSIIINVYLYYYRKNLFNISLAMAAFSLAPYVYCREQSVGWSAEAWIYFSVATLGGVIGTFFQRVVRKEVFIATHFVAALVTMAFAYSNEVNSLILTLGLLLAAEFVALSYAFKEDVFTGIGAFLVYLVSWQIIQIAKIEEIYFTLILMAIALIFHLAGQALADKKGVVLRILGLVGFYAAPVFALGENGITLWVAGGAALAGVVSYFESYKTKSDIGKYFSAGVIMIAFQLLLYCWQVREQHVYTALWAAFFGVLAYMRKDKSEKDTLTVISLGLLTLPLLFQAATDYEKGHLYGLILGMESIVILLGGMSIKNKILVRWGSVILVIIVLNQLKDTLLALPKWLIIGVVGLAFLVGATYLLSKRQENEK